MSLTSEVLADGATAAYLDLTTLAGSDVSGNGQSLVEIGTVPAAASIIPLEPTWSSRSFDGNSGDELNAPSQGWINFGDTFTWELWVTLSRYPNAGEFPCPLTQDSPGPQIVYSSSVNAFVGSKDGTGDLCWGTTQAVVGVLYHVVLTKSGSTVKLYVNGQDDTRTVFDRTFASGLSLGIHIGRIPAGGGLIPWVGNIHGVCGYPTALSRERVRAHTTAGAGVFFTPTGSFQ